MKFYSCLVAFAALSANAFAVWSDNFDSYATGSQLIGQGGWEGWGNDPGAGALTSNAQALSAPNAAAIGGGSDLVHQFSGVNSGAWTFSTGIYMPSGRAGTTYFILMNTYSPSGPWLNGHWSIELSMSATGAVLDDFRPETPRSLVLDAWNVIRVDIDLTANTQSTYINGALLSAGTWTTDGDSALNLANVDLFANGTSNVYYDNMSLVPEPGSLAALTLGAIALLRRRRKA